MISGARRLGLLTFACCASRLGAQFDAPLTLRHLVLTLDSATYADIAASPFLTRQFAAVRIDTADAAVRAITFFGRRGSVTFRPAGGAARGGDVAIFLATEAPGASATLARRVRTGGFDVESVVRADALLGLPRVDAWRPAGSAALSERAQVWVEEYATESARALALRDSAGLDDRSRRRALAPWFDRARLVSDLTGATLALPAEDIAKLRRVLERAGALVASEGEGLVVTLGDVTLRLIPAWERPGVRRLDFALLREAVANPIYRFGARSRLRFGPGRAAIWEFILP